VCTVGAIQKKNDRQLDGRKMFSYQKSIQELEGRIFFDDVRRLNRMAIFLEQNGHIFQLEV
jgi:hypothetical protein